VAKLLLLLQLIVALVILPFWPGLEARYAALGWLYFGVAVGIPFAGAWAVYGPRTVVAALADAWAVRPLGRRAERSAAVWALGARLFSASGVLGGLVALVGAVSRIGPSADLLRESGMVVLFALVWGLLGVLVSGILQRTVARLVQLPPVEGASLVPRVAPDFGLTHREAEVAGALLEGLSYRDIGERLGIAPATVKSHVLRTYEKTGAGSKLELLRMVEARAGRLHQKADGASAGPG